MTVRWVEWSLSTSQYAPLNRLFTISGRNIDFTHGFETLHTVSYKKILQGEGFSLESAREGIRCAETIRSQCEAGRAFCFRCGEPLGEREQHNECCGT